MVPAPIHFPPLEVAAETFLLRSARPVAGAPLLLYANSLVIRGAQPVVVDTGMRADRSRWLADLTALVEPARVRWVVLSHDGEDHRGNLAPLLDLCENAEVVTCWTGTQRVQAAIGIPSSRLRWVGETGTLEAGDRVLRTLRPPVYGSPASRAVFDPVTGLLWASEVFAVPMPPRPVERVEELPPGLWAEGMAMFHHHALSPWLSIVDRRAYAEEVSRLRALDPAVVVGAHTPVIGSASLEAAFAHLAALPDVVPPPHPARPTVAHHEGSG